MNAPGAISLATQERDSAPVFAALPTCKAELLTPAALLADPILAEQWDALANQASEPNPFAERWYLSAALQALDSDTIRIAVVRDHGLIGIMPLHWQSRYAGLPIHHVQNWLNHNAFLGTPLVRKRAEQLFWRALFGQMDQAGGQSLFLHLTGIASQGPLAAAMESVCVAEGRRFACVHQEERALLEKGLSPDAYLETHVRGKKRKELRRQKNRLAEEGTLTFQRSDDGEALDQWIEDFLTLEMRGWKGANGSALGCADETRKLFRDALHGGAASGKLERLDLRLDGMPIAMLANFLTAPGAFSFKTAFDEDYSRFSPGVLLQIENLALLERDDIEWCDSCAAADHPMIDSLWAGRRAIGRYSIAIGGRAKRSAFAALLTAEKTKARLKGKGSK